MSRGGVRVVIVSPNVIAEPYQGPQRWLSPVAFFTPAGWRELGNRVRRQSRPRRFEKLTRPPQLVGRLKSVYTVAKVKKDVPNWSLGSFKADAIQVYTEICTAIAAGDHASLRHKTTESQLTDIKRCGCAPAACQACAEPACRELKQRAAGGWKRVAWSLVEVQECSVVHGRLVAPNPKDATNSWAQLTVALKSTQRFAAYDERGKLVAGDPKELLTVQDYWVLERAMVPGLPEGLKRWRCAARMSLPH